ncbi:MAG: flagellar basal body-associated FliL family protein [Bdellovibrionales bacterium]|nr:flagellar basal body-associated FliL family protein [Bdellovibrionales bacterium]
MSEEKKETASATSSSSAGGNKMVLLLTIVNTVVCLAVVGLLFVSLQKEKKAQRIEDIVAEEPAADEGSGGHGAPAGGHGAPAGGHGAPAGGHGAEAKGKKLAGFGKMVTLDQFTVNLTTPGSTTPKYVRVNISLEVPSVEVEGELSQRMPQVRNAIIDLFNSKRPSDVVSEEGRQYLKEEIRSALNGFMVSGKVKGVFFTNFALSG